MSTSYDDSVTVTLPFVTSELIEAMSQCPRKAFFILHGTVEPHRHEYEAIIEHRASDHRIHIVHSWNDGLASNSLPWSTPELCSNGVLEASDLQAKCDAISQAKHPTEDRDRAFEPHLVVGTHSATIEQRLRLAFAGFVIGQTRRHKPSSGWIIPMSSKPIRVHLDNHYPLVRKAVTDVRDLIADSSSDPPPLLLNRHCALCPFRKHCLDEAEKTGSSAEFVVRRAVWGGVF